MDFLHMGWKCRVRELIILFWLVLSSILIERNFFSHLQKNFVTAEGEDEECVGINN